MVDFLSGLNGLGQILQNTGREINRNSGIGSQQSTPSDIQTYQFFANLTPEQKRQFLTVKRAQQVTDQGGYNQILNPLDPMNPTAIFPKTLSPSDAGSPQAREAAYPEVSATIDESLKTVNDALSSPGFDSNFGKMGILPNLPGGDAADAATYIDQIRGASFLTAIQKLRGTGQISEKEGDAATSAVARLQKAQSSDSARKALSDYAEILNNAKKRAAAGTRYSSQDPMAGETVDEALREPRNAPPALPSGDIKFLGFE